MSTSKLVATTAGAYICYRLTYAWFFSPLRGIPGPFLARLTSLRRQYISARGMTAQSALEEYEKYGDVYVQGPNTVAIANPKDIRMVLGSHRFVKAEFYAALDLFGIENSVSARSPEVASLRRRQIGPYLSPAYVDRMQAVVMEHGIGALKRKWDGQLDTNGRVEINYCQDFMLATLDTICALAFGRETKSLEQGRAEIAQWATATVKVNGVRAMAPVFGWFPFSLMLGSWEQQSQSLIGFSRDSIARRREDLAAGLEKPVDLLQAFLDARDPESKVAMDEVQLQAEAMVMLLAGTDTSSTTLAWMTHLLLLHPEVYGQAVSEVRGKFALDHVITYAEARRHLPYVEACVYETLRIYPLGGGYVPRVSPPGGVTVQGHFIPAGTEINASFYGASIHKDTWVRPREFDPARFVDCEETRANFLAFSPGVRMCPGRHLAMAEVLVVMANMLKDYDWSLPEDYVHLGPSVVDGDGYPQRMDSAHFLVTAPVDPERDCRVVLRRVGASME